MASFMNSLLGGKVKDSKGQQPDDTRVSACLFNLVVYCQDPDRLEYLQKLVMAIIEHFPCRITLIFGSQGQGADSIVSKTTVIKADKGVGTPCDQLLIESTPAYLYRVPFLIWPFLLPDLPLFLIWDCDPTAETEILPQLQRYASRLIFDSETVDNLQHFSQRLLAYADANKRDLVDLNWTRIGGWRDVLSRIFDTESRIHDLRSASSLTICYNALENRYFHHNQTQAIYLQAWLAAQLGWKHAALSMEKGRSEVTYRHGKGVVKITLQPQTFEERAPGSIFSIEVEGAGHHHLLVKRQPNSNLAVIESSSDETCELPFTLNLRGTQLTYSFLKEALYLYGSEHYRYMLHLLKQQDWNRG